MSHPLGSGLSEPNTLFQQRQRSRSLMRDNTPTLTFPENAAQIHRCIVSTENVLVSVTSHGGTQQHDFQLCILQSTPLILYVERLRHDHCRARPFILTITLSFDSLPTPIHTRLQSGEAFVLHNPFVAEPANQRGRS